MIRSTHFCKSSFSLFINKVYSKSKKQVLFNEELCTKILCDLYSKVEKIIILHASKIEMLVKYLVKEKTLTNDKICNLIND